MLVWFVILYLLVSIGIGLYAATRVHSAKDFAVAGRHLPLPVVTATVFATWFGAETVLGISATFVKEGMGGVVADPFGASLCLILAGLFFANKLYRMNLLTIGDFYRVRYNKAVELIAAVCIVISYLGWVSAQIMALGLVFNVVSDGGVSREAGMVIGALIVLTYTTFGGMWSVALLDFVQMTVIMCGMLFIAWFVSGMTGGVGAVVSHAQAAGKLDFFPRGDYTQWVPFIGAWLTMMLGSIPQQDVFQRITAAKNEKTAVRGSVLGGSLYFAFAFVPMFLAYSATLVDPKLFGDLLEQDSQLVLPTLILEHTPVFAQVIFFGALLSAIMSCSSATLLAPSVAFTENILKHFMFKNMTDHQFLRAMRITLWGFGAVVLTVALNSQLSIFKMVENAYKITLVAAFVPLAFGLYWKRANTQGALLAMLFGLSSWALCEALEPSEVWPPQLIGLLMSMVGMVAGSVLPNLIGKPLPQEPEHAYLHHHAASLTDHVPAPHHHSHSVD
ncbi:sodium:solute symporter [Ferrigenium kumadai]|uniref:Sodium:solute symporter n=1 Tax=Ferrigenium kumadai TaxID=1682490 RepID=A0AAN1W0I6_9PROT|nr:sodium:solute symporter family protein [Ferrigenium kumadai]BBJ00416.1 sodium:solute symporter [Ferrigenium kumadai]